MEVRFEDLVRETPRVLAAICDALNLLYTEAMLDYHRRALSRLTEHRDRHRADGTLIVSHAGRVAQQALTTEPPQPARAGAWKTTLTDDEHARFTATAGDLLADLGYAT